MDFDAERFLVGLADAYNGRDPERLRSFFALDDPRFGVFEDFTGELLDGEGYAATLEAAEGASGTMTYELLRCDRFGDFAVVHAVQEIDFADEEEGIARARIRATMLVLLGGGSPRVAAAHFSTIPGSGDDCMHPGACCGSE